MSKLQNILEEYLRVRRSLGVQFHDVERQLGKFVSFLDGQGLVHITTAATSSWLNQMDISQTTKASRLGMVRHFAQYLSAIDSRNEIPPAELFPYRYRRKQPYIYSDDEIVELLHAAKHLPSTSGFQAKTFPTLLGLLVVTGMRIGECLALDDHDVDLDEGMLAVVGTKFRKSRLIPLHPSTQEELRRYRRCRKRLFPIARSPNFLVSNRGTRLWKGNVRNTFIRLACQIGLRKPSDRHGPRIHDFRHRFAVKTLVDWYRAGIDVEQHIEELATYLGHVHASSTYWYLSATPELLRLAAGRLDR